ncbi:hypothetical protein ACF0H5_022851 [Mactra antiquata]
MAYCRKLCEIFTPVLSNGETNPFVLGVSLGTHPSKKLDKHNKSKAHASSYYKKQCQINLVSHTPHELAMLQQESEKRKTEEIIRNTNHIHIISALLKKFFLKNSPIFIFCPHFPL